ncbi:unnamed protein product [Darwinula stevensoni]|uniref:[heparan sulfate]-glucosamine N-sulfotransferase n=1 Tax=Darwinula stevensoni TaxID=69355 RepID=A0A7R8X6T1_9CRUS|nr:unnamed protein product [Darwinula stevensoni]CAG0888422.1 unnamed protein product [Darwinula stevensoni]
MSTSTSRGSLISDDVNGRRRVAKGHHIFHSFLNPIFVFRLLLAFLLLSLVSILALGYYVSTGRHYYATIPLSRPVVNVPCAWPQTRGQGPMWDYGKYLPAVHEGKAQLRLDPRALLFVTTTHSSLGKSLAEWLVANRIRLDRFTCPQYKLEVAGKSLPVLTNEGKGKFGVIIFENFYQYLHMDSWHRGILDKYCREYQVGVLGFLAPQGENVFSSSLPGFPLSVELYSHVLRAELNPESRVLRITRPGDVVSPLGTVQKWVTFRSNHSTYKPVEWVHVPLEPLIPFDQAKSISDPPPVPRSEQKISVLLDEGQYDGIPRILFGAGLGFWLHHLLLLDGMSYLSHGRLSDSLTRYLLVDIDDIFVGKSGFRLIPPDVLELVEAQRRLQSLVPGFRFNLGFSGGFHHRGTPYEDEAEDLLLYYKDEFWWFPHMWTHMQPHSVDNITALEAHMVFNKQFAVEQGLPMNGSYAIAPHHSGVYPVHEPLYEAWKSVWGVEVTATEEYPHLRPPRLRRGFIHNGIKVLPRQTCGLYTHTNLYEEFPGGKEKLEESIRGGELFLTLVSNRVNVFMTHMSNYALDRLGSYVFESAVQFLRCWTNLRLETRPPLQLADIYFDLYPEEQDPIWGNPCQDKRHLEIWSKNKSCERLPNFLIIGPQKTGTTALYSFLSIHPAISSNRDSPETFEELQFFSGKNYQKGIDWYMSFFPPPANDNETRYLFEKSANYFDGTLVPQRVHALLPSAHLITILIPPSKRAYSWYHHQRVHNDKAALEFSFHEVITANPRHAPRALRELHNR